MITGQGGFAAVLTQSLPSRPQIEKCAVLRTDVDGQSLGQAMSALDALIAGKRTEFINQEQYEDWAKKLLIDAIEYVGNNINLVAVARKPRTKKPRAAATTTEVVGS